MLQYEEEFAAVLTAVNVHVTEVYAPLVRFRGYVCSETLGKGGFSSANLACYDNPLSHPFWKLQQKIEKFHQQAVFFFSMRQAAGNVVDVEFCLVFEHALMGRHRFKPQIKLRSGCVILFACRIISIFGTKA
jgi:hypothetical protein